MTMVPAGAYILGPTDGQLLVKVFKEGVAAKMGHDLVFEVTGWQAKVVVEPDPAETTLEASAEVPSFSIVEANGGAKPLSRSDRADIKRNIEEKILDAARFPTISFRSTGATVGGPGAALAGELTIGGTTRPIEIALTIDGGRARGTFTVVQSQFGIKPFKALMGSLKIRDAVDVVLDVRLPDAG